MGHDDHAEVSKSQRKREMDELQHLGTELLGFTDDALRQLDLPDDLLDAIRTAKHINTHGARKRQIQYIGKLMREIDATPIRQALETRDLQKSTLTREFHLLEDLREKLLVHGDSALPEVLAHFPRADRQHLRKLVRQARREHETGQPPRASRLVFRYLREIQEESGQPY